MRVVVSGTHASGKSTLISDFATRHPEFTVLPDPFELLDESSDSPSVAMFAAQLRRAPDRGAPGTRLSALEALLARARVTPDDDARRGRSPHRPL